jgi:hypothetical protein
MPRSVIRCPLSAVRGARFTLRVGAGVILGALGEEAESQKPDRRDDTAIAVAEAPAFGW